MKVLVALFAFTATAAADNRCVIDKVVAPPAPTLAAPACHRPPKSLEQPLVAAITKTFHATQDGAKARVVFPCDGLGAQLDEVILETGHGHGGSLSLYRAVRTGASYDVRGIAYRGGAIGYQPTNPPFERVAGRVTLDLARVRAAVTAQVTEVLPARKPGDFSFGRSASSSSHDFHVLIRLRDSDGRTVERTFTGYEGSDHQAEFLGLVVAQEALAPITALPATKTPVDADDRALFADRFTSAVAHFDQPSYWFVMERYVDLARFLGTPKVIPGLLTRMAIPKPGDRSRTDARRDALAALATITGWDARTGVTEDEAAKLYLARCR